MGLVEGEVVGFPQLRDEHEQEALLAAAAGHCADVGDGLHCQLGRLLQGLFLHCAHTHDDFHMEERSTLGISNFLTLDLQPIWPFNTFNI